MCAVHIAETKLWAMTVESGSMTSSQWSDEGSIVLHLILITLAGEQTQIRKCGFGATPTDRREQHFRL